ncbi:MAG: hypothetical protein ACXW4O_11690, partial [Candidatus Binatia bacterium]
PMQPHVKATQQSHIDGEQHKNQSQGQGAPRPLHGTPRSTIRDNSSGLGKFLDAQKPRGRVSHPPRYFFAPFAFFAAILLFSCGSAALTA